MSNKGSRDTYADTYADTRAYLERWTRKVKFSAEEMAVVLDDVVWLLANRYRETTPVPVETWVERIASELMICEDRKAMAVHGEPDLLRWVETGCPSDAAGRGGAT